MGKEVGTEDDQGAQREWQANYDKNRDAYGRAEPELWYVQLVFI